MIYITELPYIFSVKYYSDEDISNKDLFLLLVEPSANRVVNQYMLTLTEKIDCIYYARFEIQEKQLPHNGNYIAYIVYTDELYGDYNFIDYSVVDYNVFLNQSGVIDDSLVTIARDNANINVGVRTEKSNNVVILG